MTAPMPRTFREDAVLADLLTTQTDAVSKVGYAAAATKALGSVIQGAYIHRGRLFQQAVTAAIEGSGRFVVVETEVVLPDRKPRSGAPRKQWRLDLACYAPLTRTALALEIVVDLERIGARAKRDLSRRRNCAERLLPECWPPAVEALDVAFHTVTLAPPSERLQEALGAISIEDLCKKYGVLCSALIRLALVGYQRKVERIVTAVDRPLFDWRQPPPR